MADSSRTHVPRVGSLASRCPRSVRLAIAGSTGRRNTGIKSLCRGFELQGLTWPLPVGSRAVASLAFCELQLQDEKPTKTAMMEGNDRKAKRNDRLNRLDKRRPSGLHHNLHGHRRPPAPPPARQAGRQLRFTSLQHRAFLARHRGIACNYFSP
jgi:hypothetical protein